MNISIIKSKRKTIAIQIKSSNEILVKAPTNMSKKAIDK